MTTDQTKTLKFIKEIDAAKYVKRVIHLQDSSMEDDAQHSWHLCLMVWLLSHFFEKKINLEKALKLALMHDLVEIYAGDTFFYDHQGRKGKKEREDQAANKLFKLLPKKLRQEMHKLWQEYEEKATSEAFFVQAMDKIHPIIQISLVKGKTWQEHKITEKMLRDNKIPFTKGSKFLKQLLGNLLKEAKNNKYFPKETGRKKFQ